MYTSATLKHTYFTLIILYSGIIARLHFLAICLAGFLLNRFIFYLTHNSISAFVFGISLELGCLNLFHPSVECSGFERQSVVNVESMDVL